jgi:hypothetical protein
MLILPKRNINVDQNPVFSLELSKESHHLLVVVMKDVQPEMKPVIFRGSGTTATTRTKNIAKVDTSRHFLLLFIFPAK